MNGEIIRLTARQMYAVTVLNRHATLQNHLTHLRNKHTLTPEFRLRMKRTAQILGAYAGADLKTDEVEIDTPMETISNSMILPNNGPIIASVLRAGNGLLDGMLDSIHNAEASHIGMERDEKTLQPKEYYFKAPSSIEIRDVMIVDPMLATAGSSIAATRKLIEAGADTSLMRFVCVLAAPYGIRAYREEFPDIPIFTGSIDSHLDEKGFIVPGLGDAGDRMYGTE